MENVYEEHVSDGNWFHMSRIMRIMEVIRLLSAVADSNVSIWNEDSGEDLLWTVQDGSFLRNKFVI